MPPVFDENFWIQQGQILRKPDLACLRADANLYSILLLQLNEKLDYSDHGIWIVDEKVADDKFLRFIDLAITRGVELAITPEYSCPWRVVKHLLSENKLPNEHNLWVLGCESIHPKALQALIDANPEIIWIYEKDLLANRMLDTGYFFDPVCMILKTHDEYGAIRTVVIVQFKTEHFGGKGNEWERDSLIKGSKFYVLSNQIAATRMVVQICSDALWGFNFNELQDGMFLFNPLLIVHIQLNQQPFQSNYKLYRNLLFSKGDKNSSKEIITLNWARGIHVKEDTWNAYGGSGFYLKSDKLNLKDGRFNKNHSLGLFYNNWEEKKAHIYFLSYDEHVFLLRNTKPSQAAADPSQYQRTGPEMMELYKWDNSWNSVERVDDGFYALCEEIEAEGERNDLSCIKKNLEAINTERIVALTLGNIAHVDDWYKPHHLYSLRISENEHNNRINFNHDPETQSHQKRQRKITEYAYFKNHILTKLDQLPENLETPELKYDPALKEEERFLLNLHPKSGGHKWTGIFLGIATIKEAKAIRDRIQNFFRESHQGKNVIVWHYFHGNVRREHDDQLLPTITENTSKSVNSYKKTSN